MSRALVLEDSETVRQWLRQNLAGSFDLDEAITLNQARKLLASNDYDCLLFDLELPDGESVDLIIELRHDGQHQQTPLLVLTASTNPSNIQRVFEAGADDFVRKPLCIKELEARVGHVLRLRQEAQAAEHDPLTGAYNRRSLREHAERLMAETKRLMLPFSILFFDIDQYKSVNDHYGHLRGDELLKELVTLIKSHLRPYDLVFRYGGDEFLVLLPATTEQDAAVVAKKLVAAVEATPLSELSTTISVGVSTFNSAESFDSLVARADRALYAAKEAGKNQACFVAKEHSQ